MYRIEFRLLLIDLPVFGDDEVPRHESGVATGEPGLYFVGLPFIYAFSSTMIHGVGRDAERIVKVIDRRLRGTASESSESEGMQAETASASHR